jgi:hypothetical protein
VKYELDYQKYYNVPQPKIAHVKVKVDIYPGSRSADIVGSYELINRTPGEINALYVQTNPECQTYLDGLPALSSEFDDKVSGFRILRLAHPLLSGSKINMGFKVLVRNAGFSNDAGFMPPNETVRAGVFNVLGNGSLIDSDHYFPHLGYNVNLELKDKTERMRRGLRDPLPMASPGNSTARNRNNSEPDADWVSFDAVVSTANDQLAIAPGDLKASWDKGGRRYFHYVLDGPALPAFTFMSARWRVKDSVWRDVPVSIYYDAKHPYNIEHMLDSAHMTLDYYASAFGPYAFRQLRILEVPQYMLTGTVAPGTIVVNEDIDFVADIRDGRTPDYVAYRMAYYIAQQWWGQQLVGADTQGSLMMTESLAKYSALLVMEKMFGRTHLRGFLQHELDGYLIRRGEERYDEIPLIRVENQDYLYGNKGALIFYGLRDQIGEDALNRALRHFLLDHRFAAPPYPTAPELMAYILSETPSEKQQLVKDSFERIMFYDNRVISATAHQLVDGQWEIEAKLHLRKYETDGQGKETERTFAEPVEIGVFGEADSSSGPDGKVLLLDRRKFSVAEPTIRLLDPFNILIDRVPGDNRKKVSVASPVM